MKRYRSKPIEIEAVQFDGENGMEISCEDIRNIIPTCSGTLLIATLEGTMEAKPTDWIIKGTEGEFYPCKDSVFQRKYEEVKMDTLSQWEADANEHDMVHHGAREERILTLIELIRAKDEALRFYSDETIYDDAKNASHQMAFTAQQALGLTEELK